MTVAERTPMKITQELFKDPKVLRDNLGKKVVDLTKKNLTSLQNLENFESSPQEIIAIQNNLLRMDANLNKFVSLQSLNLSFNHIQVIENIDALQNLVSLNLSMNRIQKVNLNVLKSLRILVLYDSFPRPICNQVY